MFELNFIYSKFWIVAGILLAIFAVWFLYRKVDLKSSLLYLLRILRWVVVLWLFLLILKPFVQRFVTETRQPRVLILRDVSQSIPVEESRQAYTSLTEQLENEDIPFETHSFAGELFFDGTDTSKDATHLAAVLKEVENTFDEEMVASVCLISDGIYNVGANPVYTASEMQIPIHTIGIGDTVQYPDAMIENVVHNSIAYVGDAFPVEVQWKVSQMKGKEVVISVWDETDEVLKVKRNISSSQFLGTEKFLLKSDEKGLRTFYVKISIEQQEKNTINNTRYFVVDVVDNKAKIIVAYDVPHPDVKAVASALMEKQEYEVLVSSQKELDKNTLNTANAVLLFNRSGKSFPPRWNLEKTPVWHFVGGKLSRNWVTGIKGINIPPVGKSNEVYVGLNPDFTPFQLSDEWKKVRLGNFPPLNVPFGSYEMANSLQICLFQNLKNLKTDYPVLSFMQEDKLKKATWIGEGIWKWKMALYTETGSHDLFNDLMLKSLQYLLVKPDEKLLTVTPPEGMRAFKKATWNARLVDDTYQPVSNADILITFTDAVIGENYEYAFRPSGNFYRLPLSLPPGKYFYEATATWGNRSVKDEGVCFVEEYNPEFLETTARFDVLQEMAQVSQGVFFTPTGINSLVNEIQDGERLQPIGNRVQKKHFWIELKWMFFAILSLISLEWIIRKRFGLK